MSHTAELFGMAVVWMGIAAFISRFLPNWPGRIATFAILVGIPFWELPYGYYNFTRLCREEARLLVYEKIIPQESVCFDDFYEDVYRTVVGAGLSRVEVRRRTNFHQSDVTTAQVVRIKKGEERSLYCFDSIVNVKLPWRILRHDNLLNGASDGRNVARLSRFSWAGMWWQEEARPILGSGGECGVPMSQLFEAIRRGADKVSNAQ